MISPKRAVVVLVLAVAALVLPVTAAAFPASGTLTWSVPLNGE